MGSWGDERNAQGRLRRRRHSRGAGLVEYLLLVGLIALACVVGWALFGREVRDKGTAQASCVASLSCAEATGDLATVAGDGIDSTGGSDPGSGSGPWSFGRGFVSQAWDTATGLLTALVHPWDTLRGLGHAVLHPIQTATAMKDAFVEGWNRDPAEMLGRAAFEIVTLPAVAGKLSKAAGATSAMRVAAPQGHKLSAFEKVAQEMVAGAKQVSDIQVKTPFGRKVNDLARHSDSFAAHINVLLQDGWTFRYGRPWGGTYMNRATHEIVIDRTSMFSTVTKTRSLAHEVGHAVYGYESLGSPTRIRHHSIVNTVREDGKWVDHTLSKEEYVAKNLGESLKDEGAATLYNAEIRNDILAHGGPDIGVSGANEKVAGVLSDYFDGKVDRETARTLIGEQYREFHPSTKPSSTYEDYYSKPYLEDYEKFLKGKSKGEGSDGLQSRR